MRHVYPGLDVPHRLMTGFRDRKRNLRVRADQFGTAYIIDRIVIDPLRIACCSLCAVNIYPKGFRIAGEQLQGSRIKLVGVFLKIACSDAELRFFIGEGIDPWAARITFDWSITGRRLAHTSFPARNGAIGVSSNLRAKWSKSGTQLGYFFIRQCRHALS